MIRFDDILDKLTTYSEKDINLLKKAYVFAARAHKGQIRRSGEPYLSHPLEVINLLADLHLDKTTLVAGLLHDVLEDTDITAEEIKNTFGPEVLDLVEGVTKIGRVEDSSPEIRQAETIRKIILAMTDDLRVIFIKLADRIHNLKTLNFLDEEKQRQIAKETLEIYAPIANRLGMGRIKAELEDLSFRYVAPDDYFGVIAQVEPQKKKAEKQLEKMKKMLEQLMKDNNIPAEIQRRIKRPYSIYNKMKRQSIDFDEVYDFLALRLITDSVKNCYGALGIIHQRWHPLPHRFRDFIATPKTNLYQALHTTIITEDKETFEIQIRTREMNDLAENGIAAHWRYKETDAQALAKEDQRLVWLREMVELFEEQKNPKEFLKSLKTNLIPEDIYVFSPKGKVINLPAGASGLDFAFKIHSEIGLHATAAKINNRLSPLKTALKTGDIVEIVTAPEKTPSRSWLTIVSTSDARRAIKHWLNIKEKTKRITLGKKLWEKQVRKYKIAPALLKTEPFVRQLSDVVSTQIKTWDDFYSLVGLGKVVIDKDTMQRLFPSKTIIEKKASFIDKVLTRVTGRSSSGIQVKNGEGQLVSLAKCCSPIKGEPVVGYITSGKGITVHSLRCPYITKEVLAHERMVEVSWDSAATGPYIGRLVIKTVDSPGVLAKVASGIAELEGNITKAEVATFPDRKAHISINLVIRDIKHFEAIIHKISGLKEIFSVERV